MLATLALVINAVDDMDIWQGIDFDKVKVIYVNYGPEECGCFSCEGQTSVFVDVEYHNFESHKVNVKDIFTWQ